MGSDREGATEGEEDILPSCFELSSFKPRTGSPPSPPFTAHAHPPRPPRLPCEGA